MTKKIENYIAESHKNRAYNEVTFFGSIPVVEQNPLPDNVDLFSVLEQIEQRIPRHFVNDLDAVYIGDFGFVAEKGFNAYYEDGTIYVLNHQDNQSDLFDDLVHEIAHVVEGTYALDVYGDGVVESEFLTKRKKLLDILSSKGYTVPSLNDFLETNYSEDFDAFLYQEVGYQALQSLGASLFVSPYGATSLREYWANGFEEVFVNNGFQLVGKIAPAVASKIESLL